MVERFRCGAGTGRSSRNSFTPPVAEESAPPLPSSSSSSRRPTGGRARSGGGGAAATTTTDEGDDPHAMLESTPSSSTLSSSASKSRKDQLTERLSRSRRSRFFNNNSTNNSGDSNSPPPPPPPNSIITTTSPVPSSRAVGSKKNVPQMLNVSTATTNNTAAPALPAPPATGPMSPSDKKRIALAKAHRKHSKSPTKRSSAAPVVAGRKSPPTTPSKKHFSFTNSTSSSNKSKFKRTNTNTNTINAAAATKNPPAKGNRVTTGAPSTSFTQLQGTSTTAATTSSSAVEATRTTIAAPSTPSRAISAVEKRTKALALSRAKRAANVVKQRSSTEPEGGDDVEVNRNDRKGGGGGFGFGSGVDNTGNDISSSTKTSNITTKVVVNRTNGTISPTPAVTTLSTPSTPPIRTKPRLCLGASPRPSDKVVTVAETMAGPPASTVIPTLQHQPSAPGRQDDLPEVEPSKSSTSLSSTTSSSSLGETMVLLPSNTNDSHGTSRSGHSSSGSHRSGSASHSKHAVSDSSSWSSSTATHSSSTAESKIGNSHTSNNNSFGSSRFQSKSKIRPLSQQEPQVESTLNRSNSTPRAGNSRFNKALGEAQHSSSEEATRDTSPGTLQVRKTSPVVVELGFNSQWKQLKKTVKTNEASPSATTTTNNNNVTSVETTNPLSESKVGTTVPTITSKRGVVHHWNQVSKSTTVKTFDKPNLTKEVITTNTTPTSSTNDSKQIIAETEATTSAPANDQDASTPMDAPPSPPRINPWKQMSQVRHTRSVANTSTPNKTPPSFKVKSNTAVELEVPKVDALEVVDQPTLAANSTPEQQTEPTTTSPENHESSKPNFNSTTPSRLTRRWGKTSAASPAKAAAAPVSKEVDSSEPSPPNSLRGTTSTNQPNKYLDMYRRQTSEKDGASPTPESTDSFAHYHEEKKDEDDGYGMMATPVSVASMKARYGSSNSKPNAFGGRFASSSSSRGGTSTPSPIPFYPYNTSSTTAARASSPAPLYPRLGRQSPAVETCETAELNDTDVNESEMQATDKATQKDSSYLGDTIETPDRVSVSSMKARFGSASKSSGRSGTAAPIGQPKRFARPTVASSGASPRSRSVDKNSHPKGSELLRSSSVGRLRASPGMAQALSPNRLKPVAKGHSETTDDVKGEVRSDHAEFDTPTRLSVNSMKAKFSQQHVSKAGFSQPTVSSAAKRSPRKSTVHPKSPVANSQSDAIPSATTPKNAAAPSASESIEQPRLIIETPEPVNVQSMKGMFGGKIGQTSTASRARAFKAKTPFNTPASPPAHMRQSSRTDTSTPVAPPVPARPVAGVSTEKSQHSWIRKSSSESQDVQMAQESNALSALAFPPLLDHEASVSVGSTQFVSILRPKSPAMRPKSPRERPTNIPKWKQPLAVELVPSNDKMKADVPSLEQDKSTDGSSVKHHHSEDDELASQERQRLASDESVKIENCPPISPRSPRERPWAKDLDSPKRWRQRVQSSLEDKAGPEAKPTSSISRVALLNSAMARQGLPKEAKDAIEIEEPTVQQLYSLTQMAADSVHAVDFEQALSMTPLKKCSGSNEDDEETQLSEEDVAIPKELPPEFANTMERSANKPSATSRIAIPVRVVDAPSTDDQSPVDVVFGDPTTYGAAGEGGDADLSPPRVKDRARAIAKWKGGQGIRPSKSSNPGSDSDGDSNRALEQNESTTSSDKADGNTDVPAGTPDRIPSQDSSKSSEQLSSKDVATSSPSGERGASAVLRFWSDTTQEEFDGGQAWMNSDPELHSSLATDSETPPRETNVSSFRKPRAEDIKIGSVSEWKRIDSPSASTSVSPQKESFPDDLFPMDTLAGLYEEPIKGVRKDAAFDPFLDAGEAADAFDGSVLDFFNASIRVDKNGAFPSSPAPTTFSVPNFEPKTYEDPAEDTAFDRPFPVKARDVHRSWGNGKSRRSSRTNV